MKVFLSWSGETSHKVALAFRDWLPNVLQFAEPWVSSTDIDKGQRWATELAAELETCEYGIACLTKANINAPWINFEAGAISKKVGNSRLSPFLFDLRDSEVGYPLAQFNYVRNTRDDIEKLLSSINSAGNKAEKNLDQDRLKVSFDKWWPDLEDKLRAIRQEKPDGEPAEAQSADPAMAILEELLRLARTQARVIDSIDARGGASTRDVFATYRQRLLLDYLRGMERLLGNFAHPSVDTFATADRMRRLTEDTEREVQALGKHVDLDSRALRHLVNFRLDSGERDSDTGVGEPDSER